MGSISGLEDPLEEEMTTHSSILVWRIPWKEETDVWLKSPFNFPTEFSTLDLRTIHINVSMNNVWASLVSQW